MLNEWSCENRVRGRDCAIGYGISLAEPVDLPAGVRFEMLSTGWPVSSRIATFFQEADWWRFASGEVWEENAFKVGVDFEIGPVLYKPGEDKPSAGQTWAGGDWLNNHFDALFETLTLHFGCYVSWNVMWWEFREVVAFGLCRGGLFRSRSDNMHSHGAREVTSDGLAQATQLFVKRMNSRDRRLDVAIGRWVKSQRPYEDLPDQFIDLRTALEALYIGKGQGELGFRMATHGAWHLGEDFTERQKYQKMLREAYNTASSAVHNGEIDKTAKNYQLLSAAQDLCRRGILQCLDDGCIPIWNDLILGKNTN